LLGESRFGPSLALLSVQKSDSPWDPHCGVAGRLAAVGASVDSSLALDGAHRAISVPH